MDDNDRFPREDWRFDVANGGTNLGYDDWLAFNTESEAGPAEIYEGMPTPRLPFPKIPTGEMTRGNQTFLIIAAIVAVALGALWYSTRLPDGHYLKSCQGVVFMDKACEASVHAGLMMRGIL